MMPRPGDFRDAETAPGRRLASLAPSLFGDLDDASADALAARMRRATFAHRSALFRCGDPAEQFFVIIAGHARLTRLAASGKEVATDLLGPGEILGEGVLFGESERQTSAHAIGALHTYVFGGAGLAAMTGRSLRFTSNLATIAHGRGERLCAALEDIACAQVPARLLLVLDRIAARHGRPTSLGRYVGVELTHAEIALFIASSRETVSLILGVLAREGALRLDKRKIYLADRGTCRSSGTMPLLAAPGRETRPALQRITS